MSSRAAAASSAGVADEGGQQQFATTRGGERHRKRHKSVDSLIGEPRDHDRALQTRQVVGRRRRAGGGRRECRVVLQDRALELLQSRAGVESELVGQRAPGLAQHVEGLDRPPGPVERHGQVRAQRLAQRVLGDERAQLPHELRVMTALELGLDPPLHRVQAHLVESQRLGHEQAALGDVRQSGPAPQGERLGEGGRRLLRLPVAQELGPGCRVLLEAVHVPAGALDVKHVGVTARLDRIASERPPQIRYMPLDDIAGTGRRRIAPHLVDQAPDRHRPVRADHEHGEHGTTTRAADSDDTLAFTYLQRPENPVVVHARASLRLARADGPPGEPSAAALSDVSRAAGPPGQRRSASARRAVVTAGARRGQRPVRGSLAGLGGQVLERARVRRHDAGRGRACPP